MSQLTRSVNPGPWRPAARGNLFDVVLVLRKNVFMGNLNVIILFVFMLIGGGGASQKAHAGFSRPLVRPTIALVVSIDIRVFGLPSDLAGKARNWYVSQIVQEYNAAFHKSGLGLKIYRDGDAQVLAHALEDASNVGVFFVSHSALSVGGVVGTHLFDAQGNDVTRLLKRVHPNIKVLGFAGVGSVDFAERLKQEPAYRDSLGRDDLKIVISDHKVNTIVGTRRVVRAALPHLKDQSTNEKSCQVKRGVMVRIARVLSGDSANFGAAIVEIGGSPVAVFGVRSQGIRQEVVGWIPEDALNQKPLKAIVYGDVELSSQRFEFDFISQNRQISWIRIPVASDPYAAATMQQYSTPEAIDFTELSHREYLPFQCVQRLQVLPM